MPAIGVPATIVDEAISLARAEGIIGKRRKRRESYEVNDEVWAVFDRDDHANFAAAVNRGTECGIGIARSNPCFELWLILHFEEFDASIDRNSIQRHLAKICPRYDPNGDKHVGASTIVANVEIAEQRAERQLNRREIEGAAYSAPSTTVYQLTRRIRQGPSP